MHLCDLHHGLTGMSITNERQRSAGGTSITTTLILARMLNIRPINIHRRNPLIGNKWPGRQYATITGVNFCTAATDARAWLHRVTGLLNLSQSLRNSIAPALGKHVRVKI